MCKYGAENGVLYIDYIFDLDPRKQNFWPSLYKSFVLYISQIRQRAIESV